MGALSSSLPARAMPSRLCSSASGPSPAPAPEGRLPPTDSASCFRTYVPHYVPHYRFGQYLENPPPVRAKSAGRPLLQGAQRSQRLATFASTVNASRLFSLAVPIDRRCQI